MAGATLQQAKAHLSVDGDDHDGTIAQALEAAWAYLEKIGVSVAEPVPAPVVSAQLLLVARLFSQRGEPLEGAFRDDHTWKMLIAPYREVAL